MEEIIVKDAEQENIRAFEKAMWCAELPNELIDFLKENEFFTAPASSRFHGACEGGLFAHSLAVMETLVDLTKKNGLKWKKARSPYLVGMLHDICKVDDYIWTDDWSEIKRNPEAEPGHGDKSVSYLNYFINLTDEEAMCIRYHMGAFTDKSEWGSFTGAVQKYPNVLWTHHADMIAAHLLDT